MVNQKNSDPEVLRHSCSHIMAAAVLELYPGAKLAIGPAIDEGFYYDFELPKKLSVEDLPLIEQKMRDIIAKNQSFERFEKNRIEAIKTFEQNGEKYKKEMAEALTDEKISFYKTGEFVDMCRGPHIAYSGDIKYFKLLSVAGAYWRGDEKREQLQRIYGAVFYTKEELDSYLSRIEEAKKRDHRVLGRELDLFSIQNDEAGAGLVFWHPKGALIRNIIEDYWKKAHLNSGYSLVNIPHISRCELWKKSGHLEFYKENMYSPIKIDNQDYILKPMNCTGHNLIYKNTIRSYKELPIRYAELGTVYRYERSGVLHGLMRVRGFTQDDAHIYCAPNQLESEIIGVIEFTTKLLKSFGFNDYDIMLSTRPDKYVGSLELWDQAENALKGSLEKLGYKYTVDPGEGVFYGPKIDIKIKDCLGRRWQCSTVQVDFNNPERFDLKYRDSDGKDKQVIMVHRALMGSLERFFGILIEHYAGHFPFWLAPVQVRVMSITEKNNDYVLGVAQRLALEGFRVDTDTSNEKIGAKIRNAAGQKIPYTVIAGGKEQESGAISVRKAKEGDLGVFKPEAFIDMLKKA